MKIFIGKELHDKCPGMVLGTIECEVENTVFNKDLWEEIEIQTHHIKKNYRIDEVKNNNRIDATRRAYKACGKEPNRYRPASEALFRRLLKGKELSQINTLVDLVNLISLKSGFSIGGFDADYIEGDLRAGIGKSGEEYSGIGRGVLNIEGLPVLRDEKGGIGTPTSDEIRTAIRSETRHFFMNINGYTGENDTLSWLNESIILLKKYTKAKNITAQIIKETIH
jgi:DNA/RNA-binding domain of Phe-tRNA-synthetase-like protein